MGKQGNQSTDVCVECELYDAKLGCRNGASVGLYDE
jgi:hypothetical protein